MSRNFPAKIVVPCALILLVATAAAGYLKREALFWKVPPRFYEPVWGFFAGFRVDYDVMIPMRDGVHLATDIYYPTRQKKPLATILYRTPYSKERKFARGHDKPLAWVEQGYVVAVQDMRGKFASEGVFTPYHGDSEDSSETVTWLARQLWSNGRVGTFGCSSGGEVQMLLGREQNPHHAAMIAMSAGGALGKADGQHAFGVYEGGVFNLAATFGWFVGAGGKTPGAMLERKVDADAVNGLPTLGLVRKYRDDPTDYDDYLSRPFSDSYWKTLDYIGDGDYFSTPALIVDAWLDARVGDTLRLADLMQRHWKGKNDESVQHVIIAPGAHCGYWDVAGKGKVGDLPVAKSAAQPYDEWFSVWFGYWLRGNTERKLELPAYRFFMLGEDRWYDSPVWPPRGVKFRRWYLGGKSGVGRANTASGDGVLKLAVPQGNSRSDEFSYNPANPVPSCGGAFGRKGSSTCQAGHVDQREVESRQDVLVYTSAPLSQPLRIAGPLSAEIYVSSTARDTDFVAKLVDVRPDGTALNIQEGALRMRYRSGYDSPALMRPGQVYRAKIDMRAIAYYLPAGHRLRLQITSSNFPRLERNLNTGGNNYDETVGVVAMNRVYSGHQHPSSIIVPEWAPE